MPLKKQLKFADLSEDYLSDFSYNSILSDKKDIDTALINDIVKGKRLTSVIDLSFNKTKGLVLNLSLLFLCVLYIIREMLNSVAYNSILILMSGYESILSLPGSFDSLKNKYYNIFKTILNKNTRGFWFLEFRVDIINSINKVIRIIKQTVSVVKKFYLLSLVSFFILIVSSTNLSLSAENTNSQNLFFNFINNNSDSLQSGFLNESSFNTERNSLGEKKPDEGVSTIFSYTISEGDTLEYIADFHGVSVGSIKINNQEVGKLKPGSKLEIPWVDGYIYTTIVNTTISEIEELYKVTADDLLRFNIDTGLSKSNEIKAGSRILIPTKDFQKISEINESQKETRETQTELEKQRQFLMSTSKQNGELNFINPTSGYITRCTAGHGYHACDIQDSRAVAGLTVAVVAVSDGTIANIRTGCPNYRVSTCNAGLGNMLEIDHGGGVTTLYAHFRDISVSVGDSVSQGQVLGSMGNSGNSTGHHLHFEVKVSGSKQDPLLYIPGW